MNESYRTTFKVVEVVGENPQLMKEIVDDFTGFGTGDIFLANTSGAFSKDDLERIASFFNTVSDSMR